MISEFATHMRLITIVCVVLAASIFILYSKYRGGACALEDIFIVGLSAATLPTGAAISLSAFDPSLLDKIADVGVYLFLAGVAVVYIGWTTIMGRWPK